MDSSTLHATWYLSHLLGTMVAGRCPVEPGFVRRKPIPRPSKPAPSNHMKRRFLGSS